MKRHALKANLAFHRLNIVPGLVIFWIIVGMVTAIGTALNTNPNISVGVFMTRTNGQISTVASIFVAILIYTVVVSLISHPENYSLLLGMGSTRKAFYLGQIIALAGVALLNAVLMTTAFWLEGLILPVLGMAQLDYMAVYSLRLNHLWLTLIHFAMLVLLSAVCVLITTFIYRSQRIVVNIGMILVIVATLLVSPLRSGLWGNLLHWVSNHTGALSLSGKLVLLALVVYGIGWLILRRTEAR